MEDSLKKEGFIMVDEKVVKEQFNKNASSKVEAEIQIVFMKMLLDKGLISEDVHSVAVEKIGKGV